MDINMQEDNEKIIFLCEKRTIFFNSLQQNCFPPGPPPYVTRFMFKSIQIENAPLELDFGEV